MRLLCLMMALVLVAGCEQKNPGEKTGSPSSTTSPPIVREAVKGQTREVAVLRKQQVSNPSYDLDVVLNAEGEPFHGDVTIEFDFVPQGSDLTLDFNQGDVVEVLLNGKIEQFEYNGHFLTFKEDIFTRGNNALKIKFRHEYNNKRDPASITLKTRKMALSIPIAI